MSLRIAHIFPASPFLAFTADVFEAASPGANTFLVLGGTDATVDPALPARAEPVAADAAGIERMTAEIRDSDIAVFHSVGAFAATLLAAAPDDTLTVWSGWGGDYYGSNFSPTFGLLRPKTARYRRGLSTPRNRLGQAYLYGKANRTLAPAVRATDVFSAPIPNDLAVFTRRFRGFRGRYAQLNYASVEDTFAVAAVQASGDDILLGNSATLSNNHLDVLEMLAHSHQPGRRVITPLSYGDAAYADAVTARGTELLGADFVALREFMPLAEYQQVIAGCGVVVMGHRRQQGIGNVAAALSGGSHVILDERNPLSMFLRERGASIGALDQVSTRGVPVGRVDPEQRAAHARLLQEFWGRERVIANIKSLIASIGQ